MPQQNTGSAPPIGSGAGAVSDVLRRGVDALDTGFAVFGGELRLIYCNKAFRELRSYPSKLCEPGSHISELYRFNAERGDYGSGDVDELISERTARARNRKAETIEYELATGRILSIRYAPIDQDCLVLSYADVTERRLAEKALQESEERYTYAMAGANEGMWDWIANGDSIFVSDSYKRLIGIQQEANEIALSDWVSLIHPDDLAVRDRARIAHFEGKTEFYDCEYRVRFGGGEYRWFRDCAQSYRDDRGKIVRMVGSMTDITARKQVELDLLKANSQINAQNKALASLSQQLSKYLSPHIYSSIFSGKQAVEVSSQRKKLTVFFTDVVDFTEITEHLESEELTDLLNHFLSEMSKIALEHGATIDKYIGDAIMGFFGDPESHGPRQDALDCVRMAIEMQDRMSVLQRHWHDQGIERPFELRIGVNTGYCTVGNFGSEDRMDYTIIGTEANLASRLQSQARPGGIMIAHETFSLIKDTIAVEEAGTLTVKGFTRPIRCYEVIGRLNKLIAEGRILREYDEGLRIFLDLYHGDRSKVISVLERLLGDIKSSDYRSPRNG
ncbi:MAG: PAS-domain containing protein [Hyphomicrobiaceae bacterium]